MRVGDSFKAGRYAVSGKLGWGHFSTVWLARDATTGGDVALKVQKSASHYTEAAYDEIEILRQARRAAPVSRLVLTLVAAHPDSRRRAGGRELRGQADRQLRARGAQRAARVHGAPGHLLRASLLSFAALPCLCSALGV